METVYKERKLLKKLISISKQFNNQNVKFTDFDIDDNDYYLNQLIQKRLIIKTGNQWDEHDRIIPDYYQVTDYGLHFFEERREETLQFIKKKHSDSDCCFDNHYWSNVDHRIANRINKLTITAAITDTITGTTTS